MGDGKPLAFAAGKGGAVFSDDRLIAIRQLLNEFVAVGGLGGGDHHRVCRVLAAHPDVLHHGVVKQHNILEYHGEVLHQNC